MDTTATPISMVLILYFAIYFDEKHQEVAIFSLNIVVIVDNLDFKVYY